MTLKELREKNNLLQKELAKKIGVKVTTLSMWETGNSKPKLVMLPKLAKVFNVSIDEIVKCFNKSA